jgi:hypothetical protein
MQPDDRDRAACGRQCGSVPRQGEESPVAVSIDWQFQAAIQGGPVLLTNVPAISVAGYDVIQVTIPATTAGFAVPVQPSATAGDVIFFAATSSQYDPGLTYQVDALGVVHALDGPHFLLGSGAVGFLNSAAPPQKLTFDNTLASPVDIQILVGRKVR